MTKIIDLPTTASTDANTFVPVYKNGKTQKVSATALGGGGSGLDLTSTTDVTTVDGTEYVPLNKPLGTVLRVTVQRILDWILARANTWTAAQTINANLNFSGSTRRITGDFSNATIVNRTIFQSSTTNGITSISASPNGTSGTANFSAYSTSDPTNSSRVQIAVVGGTSVNITSDITGTGTYLPMLFYTNGTERVRINTDGGVGIGKTADVGLSLDAAGGVQFASGADGGFQKFKYSTVNANSRSWRLGSDISAYGDFRFQVSTTQTGSTFTDVISVDSITGGIFVNSGLFGYGAGTGGTVTQASSRATTVTLNKPSGSITLFSAAGTATWGSFAVLNSTVSATDTISLSVSGGSNVYLVSAYNVTSGSFRIVFSAVAGTATDAPIINFNVIRGSNS